MSTVSASRPRFPSSSFLSLYLSLLFFFVFSSLSLTPPSHSSSIFLHPTLFPLSICSSSILLTFSSFLTQRRQVCLIIVQVFFKEWITRSIFTASFSLSLCLRLSFLCFASRLRFLMHSRNKRDSEWKKRVAHQCYFFCTLHSFLYVYNFLSCLRCVMFSAFFLRFLVTVSARVFFLDWKKKQSISKIL